MFGFVLLGFSASGLGLGAVGLLRVSGFGV